MTKPKQEELPVEGIDTACEGDPVIKWRFGQLLRAGASPLEAETLALRRDIDLHLAVEITEQEGSTMALRVLY